MISEFLPAVKQFQDSKPRQSRLAATQALLCTQGSCIFNFTMKGFFLTPFLHVTESSQDRWPLMENGALWSRGRTFWQSEQPEMHSVSWGSSECVFPQQPQAYFSWILRREGQDCLWRGVCGCCDPLLIFELHMLDIIEYVLFVLLFFNIVVCVNSYFVCICFY
jgi:hypothetical protein